MTTARSGKALPNTSPKSTNDSTSCQYALPSIISAADIASTPSTAANTTVARMRPASTGNTKRPGNVSSPDSAAHTVTVASANPTSSKRAMRCTTSASSAP